jgi:hypothetical protein
MMIYVQLPYVRQTMDFETMEAELLKAAELPIDMLQKKLHR